MLHTPVPNRIAPASDEPSLPPGAGILIAMGGSICLWVAIYAGCLLAF